MCQARVAELLKGMDGVGEVKVDWQASKAVVTMKPGAKFDETKAHELIDRDYKLVECVEVTN